MALLAISDLHLAYGVEKPMDIFGPRWAGYMDRLNEAWREIVKPEDTVVIPGDISWAIDLNEFKKDIIFLDGLPGNKIISKGNHDYWWQTMNKLNKYIEVNEISSIKFLYNNYFEVGNWIICGTRGWTTPGDDNFSTEDAKIFARETARLELSIQSAKKIINTNRVNGIVYNSGIPQSNQILVMLHYPPFNPDGSDTKIVDIMAEAGVTHCIYGHLHGDSCTRAFEGERNGIMYRLVSADHLNFRPLYLD